MTYPLMWLAAMALPALVGVYFLHHRFKRMEVSSLLLWFEGKTISESGSKLNRMQWPWILLLEILIFTLLVLAGVDLRWTDSANKNRIVVVVDNSLSMQAVDSKGASARARAEGEIEKVLRKQNNELVAVLLAGEETVPVVGDSATDLLLNLDDAWRCDEAQANLAGAVSTAIRTHPAARILVLSDHVPEAIKGRFDSERLVWEAVGKSTANLAIVRAARSDKRCVIEVANYSGEPADTEVRWKDMSSGRAFRSSIGLAPSEVRTVQLPVQLDYGDIVARISDEDAVKWDNQAWLLDVKDPPLRVRLDLQDEETRGLVGRALLATGKVVFQPAVTRSELVITDRDLDTGLVPRLRLHTQGGGDSFVGPYVTDRSSPLLEGLSFNGLVWGRNSDSPLPGVPLVSVGQIPLLTRSGPRRLDMGFDYQISNIQATPAWPGFFWNLVDERLSQRPGFARRQVRVGVPIRLRAARASETIKVSLPDGSERELQGTRREWLLLERQTGIYKATGVDWGSRMAQNAIAPAESDLSICTTRRAGKWQEEPDQQSRIRRSSAPWLLVAALMLLAWHHRLVRTPVPTGTMETRHV